MWEFPGGPMRTFAQVPGRLRRAKNLLGRDFRDRIWSGHNPFGPQAAIAAAYTGWLERPAEGEYAFAISSQNASFLLVDGNVLIDNGGMHGPQGDVSRNAKLHLSPGLVKLTFYHVSGGGDPIAVVAWCPPSERDKRNFTFVPPGAFAPIRPRPGPPRAVRPGPPSTSSTTTRARPSSENRYYQRYAFSAMAAGARRRAAVQWKWDFGDGQTSAEAPAAARLPRSRRVQGHAQRAARRGGADAGEPRLSSRAAWDHVTDNRLDAIREHAAIVAKYDFRALPPGAAAEAVILLPTASRSADGVLKAGGRAASPPRQPVRAGGPGRGPAALREGDGGGREGRRRGGAPW